MLQAVKCQDGHGDKYYKINTYKAHRKHKFNYWNPLLVECKSTLISTVGHNQSRFAEICLMYFTSLDFKNGGGQEIGCHF